MFRTGSKSAFHPPLTCQASGPAPGSSPVPLCCRRPGECPGSARAGCLLVGVTVSHVDLFYLSHDEIGEVCSVVCLCLRMSQVSVLSIPFLKATSGI